MDKNLIEKFYQEILSDGDFKKILIDKIDEYKDLLPEERNVIVLKELILPKSEELGYNFKLSELIEYEKKYGDKGKELTLEDLENIAGGLMNPRIAAASFASLTAISALLGVGSFFANSNSSNAVANSSPVSQTAEFKDDNFQSYDENKENSDANKFNFKGDNLELDNYNIPNSYKMFNNEIGNKMDFGGKNLSTPKNLILDKIKNAKSNINDLANKIIQQGKDKLEAEKLDYKNNNELKNEENKLEQNVAKPEQAATNSEEAKMPELGVAAKEEVKAEPISGKRAISAGIKQQVKKANLKINKAKDDKTDKLIQAAKNMQLGLNKASEEDKALKTEKNEENKLEQNTAKPEQTLINSEESKMPEAILVSKEEIKMPEPEVAVIEENKEGLGEVKMPEAEVAVNEEVKEAPGSWDRAVPAEVEQQANEAEKREQPSDLLAQIRQGKKLKHVEVNADKDKSVEKGNDLAEMLQEKAKEMSDDEDYFDDDADRWEEDDAQKIEQNVVEKNQKDSLKENKESESSKTNEKSEKTTENEKNKVEKNITESKKEDKEIKNDLREAMKERRQAMNMDQEDEENEGVEEDWD